MTRTLRGALLPVALGVLALARSGTATDCRYLVPAAELAVAGLVAAG